MKRRLAIAALLLAALFVGLCVRSYGVPGQTQNGGITVHFGSMYYGYEIWGAPGFFTEDCSEGC